MRPRPDTREQQKPSLKAEMRVCSWQLKHWCFILNMLTETKIFDLHSWDEAHPRLFNIRIPPPPPASPIHVIYFLFVNELLHWNGHDWLISIIKFIFARIFRIDQLYLCHANVKWPRKHFHNIKNDWSFYEMPTNATKSPVDSRGKPIFPSFIEQNELSWVVFTLQTLASPLD